MAGALTASSSPGCWRRAVAETIASRAAALLGGCVHHRKSGEAPLANHEPGTCSLCDLLRELMTPQVGAASDLDAVTLAIAKMDATNRYGGRWVKVEKTWLDEVAKIAAAASLRLRFAEPTPTWPPPAGFTEGVDWYGMVEDAGSVRRVRSPQEWLRSLKARVERAGVPEASDAMELAARRLDEHAAAPRPAVTELQGRIRRLEALVTAHHAAGVMEGRQVGDPCPVCQAEAPLEDRLLVQAAKFEAVAADVDRRRAGQASVAHRELIATRDLLREARAAVLAPDGEGVSIGDDGHQPAGDSEVPDS
jgi:hypothetical protein